MKYSKENLEKEVLNFNTISDLVRSLRNSEHAPPSSVNLVSKKLKEFNIDTSHFIGSLKSKDNLLARSKHYSEILIFDNNLLNRVSRNTLFNAITLKGSLEYKCSECVVKDTYNNKPLKLQIDHIDGNWRNNLITNLRFLCPNCHSQTDTYGFTGEQKY